MRFKEFYLTEASKEYNYIKLFVDKIEKVLNDFSKNRYRYHEYETPNGWEIPLRKIIDTDKFPKDGVLDKLSNGSLFLSYGELDLSKSPIIRINRKMKDGSIQEHTVKAMFSPSKNRITIPFVDEKTDRTYIDKIDKISSTLLHEFTHMLQNVSGNVMKGTLGTSESAWFKDSNEREAILNQIYKEYQNIVSNMLKIMKQSKELYQKNKDKDYYKEFLQTHNELAIAFEDVETFEKFFEKNLWKIRYTNKRLEDVILYFKKHFYEEFEDFFIKMYKDLKKEFKNVLPEKELK